MTEAWIDGRPAALGPAVEAAASLLAAARCPVIAGLATDVAGAEAAVGLARRLGAVLDHDCAPALLRDLDAMREGGLLTTTPLQLRARADLVVLVGAVTADGLGLDRPPLLADGAARRVIAIEGGEHLPAALGVLRALVGGRPVAPDAPRRAALAECAAALNRAAYAVIVWSATTLDALSVAMLAGLIDDLNATTRCAGVTLPPPGNAAGVAQALGWRCGFPVRLGFGRGAAEHDPWRFDAARLVDSGEADAALWIAALPLPPPHWTRRPKLVVLAAPGTAFASPPAVSIVVGRPGADHAATLFDPRLGALAQVAAAAPSTLPCVADVLARIAAGIAAPAAAAC